MDELEIDAVAEADLDDPVLVEGCRVSATSESLRSITYSRNSKGRVRWFAASTHRSFRRR